MELKIVIVNNENGLGSTGIMINRKYILTSWLGSKQSQPKNSTITTKLFNRFIDLECVLFKSLPNHIIEQSLYLLQNCTFLNQSNKISPITHLSSSISLYEIAGEKELNYNIDDIFKQWYKAINKQSIHQSQKLIIKAVPFGNKHFLNSVTKGIVSNVIGTDSCLILSDCSTTPGCEGGAVYIPHCDYPIGIVLASSCWWKGDYTGLTVILNLKAFFSDLFSINNPNLQITSNNNKLLDAINYSLVQVYSGSNWGTGIVIDATQGLIITNSHVIENDTNIRLFWKDNVMQGKLLYKIPDGKVFDLAIIQCTNLNKNIIPIKQNKNAISLGETVYAIGYCLISKNQKCNPSISKGVITQLEKSMIKTSCCINPGMSGGPILNTNGNLIGIIVCNSRMQDDGRVNPRFNMCIPYSAIVDILRDYLTKKDITILHRLYRTDLEWLSPWNCINNSKL